MRSTILTRQLSHTGIHEVNTAADLPGFETRGESMTSIRLDTYKRFQKQAENGVVYAIVEIHLFSDFFQA
jgi:hypothetical protein